MAKLYHYQFFRAIACLLVCFSHLFMSEEISLKLYNYLIAPGQFGVGIFFFVSGYLITRSLFNDNNIKFFLIKRAFRIYPVYIFVSLIVISLYLLYGYSPRCGNYGNSTILAQLFMVSDVFGKCRLISVQWTLFVELKFYLIVALSYYLANRNGFDVSKFIKIFLGLIIAVYAACSFKHNGGWPNGLITSAGGMCFIFIGVLYFLREKRLICYQDWILLTFASMTLGILGFYNFEEKSWMLFQSLNFVGAGLFCLWILKKKLKYNSIINFFAEISYPLYLVHFMVIISPALENIFWFAAMIFFSWLIHVFIEKPAIQFSKNYQLFSHKNFQRPPLILQR